MRTSLAFTGGILAAITAVGVWLAVSRPVIVWQKMIDIEQIGQVAVASPIFGSHESVLVFANTSNYPAGDLAKRIATLGVQVSVIDTRQALRNFADDHRQCLDAEQTSQLINVLIKEISISPDSQLIISGLGDGALLPFLHAATGSNKKITHVSVEFSVNVPADLSMCPTVPTTFHNHHTVLSVPPLLTTDWYTAWSDHPPSQTAVFVRGVPRAKTWIAPYNTPADMVLIEELQQLLKPEDNASLPLAVVEIPTATNSDTVTIFYSGDGGWRDLDRIVAGEMAKQGYAVVGIDSLRSFWSRKSPDQAAAELIKTMDHYRQIWGTKSFVLAGYSFGADILPPIYNRLAPADQKSVQLLVLLALSRSASFEIEVSGWLGKDSGEFMLAPDLTQLPSSKVLCVFGRDEETDSACPDLKGSQAELLELPGGHHFDEDYPKLTNLILTRYQKAGIYGNLSQSSKQPESAR